MKQLLVKLREANLPITKEDFINACSQSSLFREEISYIENYETSIKEYYKEVYWKDSSIYSSFYRLEAGGLNLFLFSLEGFANVVRAALWEYAKKYMPNITIAEAICDNSFPTSDSTLELINDNFYYEDLNDILTDVSDSYNGFYYYGNVNRLTLSIGFARVNLEGTIFYLLG